MSKRGLFITFEGADGSGKSTQAEKTAKYLSKNNIENILTREPGGTDLGQNLRNILLNYDEKVSDNCEFFLYLADRSQHVDTKIMPALQQGKIVLCDRHTDSTLAYQGYARGLDKKRINELNNIATNGLIPDLTIVFDVDTEVAMSRIGGNKDRMESESADFHRKVREGYLDIAKKNPDRVRIVNSNNGIEAVFKDTINIITEFISNYQKKVNE